MKMDKFGERVFFNAPEPIGIFDIKLKAIKLNQAFLDLLELRENCNEKILFTMFDSYDLDIIYESVLENSNFKGVVTLLEKYGNRSCELFTFLEEDGEDKFIFIYLKDITDLKRVEKRLSITEDRFKVIFNNAPEAIAVVESTTGTIVDYNSFFKQLLKLDDTEIQSISYKDIVIKNSKVLQTQSNFTLDFNVSTYEDRFLTGSNKDIDVEITESKIFYNNMECDLLFIRDITDRKMIEVEIKRSKESAEEMAELLNQYSLELIQKNKELDKQKVKAEKLSQIKTDFLANMSHEIRTPLNAIISFSNLMKETDLNGVQAEFLKDINTSSNSLLTLINSVLDYSKIEANRVEVEKVDTDIREIVEEVADIISVKSEGKNLEVITVIEKEIPQLVISDPTRIRQILINLANNSAKFTNDGYVLIRCYLADGRIKFSVKDSGIGIKKEDMGKLFKGFSQVDISTTRKYGGTGLGLVITKELVELLGGNIEVESEYGSGSEFYFSIQFNESPNSSLEDYSIIEGKKVAYYTDNHALIEKSRLLSSSYGVNLITNEIGSLNFKNFDPSLDAIIVDYEGLVRESRKIAPNDIVNEKLFLTIKSENYLKLSKEGFDPGYMLKKPIKLREIINLFNRRKVVPKNEQPVKRFNGSVLVVDDVDLNRKIVVKLLDKFGIRVELATNGREAVDTILRGEFDLVFMDCLMPVMDGYQATEKIRKMGFNKDILPIVALTANSSEEQYLKVLDAGMNDFLCKPIELDALVKTLDKYLDIEKFDIREYFDVDELLLRVDNDQEFAKEIIDEFLNSLEKRERLSKEHTHNQILDSIHSLKGVALGVSASKLTDLIIPFERELKKTQLFNTDSLNGVLNCIDRYIEIKKQKYEF